MIPRIGYRAKLCIFKEMIQKSSINITAPITPAKNARVLCLNPALKEIMNLFAENGDSVISICVDELSAVTDAPIVKTGRQQRRKSTFIITKSTIPHKAW